MSTHHAMRRAEKYLSLRIGLLLMGAGQIVMQALQAPQQPCIKGPVGAERSAASPGLPSTSTMHRSSYCADPGTI